MSSATPERNEDRREIERAWLALWRAPGIGPRGFARLLELCPDLRQLPQLPASRFAPLGLAPEAIDALQRPGLEAVEADLEWLSQPDRHLLLLTDPAYPPKLREIPDPPPLLFVIGDPACLALPQLAIVGSRNASRGGVETARAFAEHLAGESLCITSGLAAGIDVAAHRGALAAGGRTIAVAGTGLDIVYPARHRELAHEIARHGALVSELPPGTPPVRENFPRRNRIISGLSLGTLVVEASRRSGSLITARYALEQGREVYAIPGSIHNPLARGCHALIRQGAKLVESVADILEELPEPQRQEPPAQEISEEPFAGESFDEDYRKVLDALGHDPVPVDLVVQRTALTPAVVSSILLVLELKGHVTAAPGGRYALAAQRDT